ncbi:hypothetical protein TPAR_08902 [Tolypocladium paradoxum]|uniref:Uncharacterized protein n=1 Tax=Tolypocladium paradoxum TaxID=94208 RepID=A0A2S4KLC8_9HYPO|nr:hypothetical protein TPAR_08902 [Tolypocladium paradoxum]
MSRLPDGTRVELLDRATTPPWNELFDPWALRLRHLRTKYQVKYRTTGKDHLACEGQWLIIRCRRFRVGIDSGRVWGAVCRVQRAAQLSFGPSEPQNLSSGTPQCWLHAGRLTPNIIGGRRPGLALGNRNSRTGWECSLTGVQEGGWKESRVGHVA